MHGWAPFTSSIFSIILCTQSECIRRRRHRHRSHRRRHPRLSLRRRRRRRRRHRRRCRHTLRRRFPVLGQNIFIPIFLSTLSGRFADFLIPPTSSDVFSSFSCPFISPPRIVSF